MTQIVWLLVLVVFLFYGSQIEPRFLRIKRFSKSDARISTPVRILFISDFHITWFSPIKILKRNLEQIKREHRAKPFDLILLGGDYFDRNSRSAKNLRMLLKEMVSWGGPVYAILGNHDIRFKAVDTSLVRKILAETNIKLLEDELIVFEKGQTRLAIVGLKDLEGIDKYLDGKFFIQNPQFYKKNIPSISSYSNFDHDSPELFRILLCHNPDGALLPGKRRADLTISGHTHGGQTFFLNWLGLLFSQVNPHGSWRSQSGIKRISNKPLIISNGFGYGVAPFRYGCPTDVYIIELVTPDK